MMVFEHVSKGNLSDHLHSCDSILSLETRLSIVIECAEALWCMHSMYRPVLHGDIKPSNILLDDNFHAKVSDFGLARLLSGGNIDSTINVTGSIGYMDPTFIKKGCLSPKIDVYSFGVVLVELITKTKPTDSQKQIVERFAQFSGKEKTVRELFDVNIANTGSMKVLEGIAKIAKECLKEKIDERPEMIIVAGRLRELRTTLEQAKEKAGRRFIPKGQSALNKLEQHETNKIATRSALSTIMTLGMFRRNAPNILGKLLENSIAIFTYKELKNITQNFSTIIGIGAYATVYLGDLADNTRVSVKLLHSASQQDRAETEMIIHSQMQHSNILKLIGCCLKNYSPALVCEYAPNGSLSNHLFVKADKGGESTADGHDAPSGSLSKHLFMNADKGLLDLKTRYQIALGVATALAYLHEERQEWVLHCDIKPENILLDDHFRPKLCDFGLSKMSSKNDVIPVSGVRNEPDFRLSQTTNKLDNIPMSGIRGTSGYLGPEWLINREPITAKADVYSFGMVLLEIVSGTRNNGFRRESVGSEDWYFPKWAYEKTYMECRIYDILDPHVITSPYDDNASVATVELMVKTALWCVQDRAEMRPSMSKVVKMLEGTVEVSKPVKPTIFCVQEE